MLAPTPEELLLPSLDTPSLEGLSWLLRHPEKWPNYFHWNYAKCTSCAIGLAYELWQLGATDYGVSPKEGCETLRRQFKMRSGDVREIFLGRNPHNPGLVADWTWDAGVAEYAGDSEDLIYSRVTPDMVADQIDAYLARRG